MIHYTKKISPIQESANKCPKPSEQKKSPAVNTARQEDLTKKADLFLKKRATLLLYDEFGNIVNNLPNVIELPYTEALYQIIVRN